jgi:hypothetical protein
VKKASVNPVIGALFLFINKQKEGAHGCSILERSCELVSLKSAKLATDVLVMLVVTNEKRAVDRIVLI